MMGLGYSKTSTKLIQSELFVFMVTEISQFLFLYKWNLVTNYNNERERPLQFDLDHERDRLRSYDWWPERDCGFKYDWGFDKVVDFWWLKDDCEDDDVDESVALHTFLNIKDITDFVGLLGIFSTTK